MSAELPFDDDLLRRLPLPLAQLYRRAHNAKSPQERHNAAYYLWETALKLLGSVLIAEAAARRIDGIAERLQSLSRPAVGHWWEIARGLLPLLAGGEGGSGCAYRLLRSMPYRPRIRPATAILCTSSGPS